MSTNTKTKAPKVPCLCGQVRVDIPQATGEAIDIALIPRNHRAYLDTVIGDEAGWVYLETFCQEQTRKTFAPGHDARLKGLLMTAAMLNAEVTVTEGGVAVGTSPVKFAQQALPGLARFVEEAATRDPEAAKAQRKGRAPKAAKAKASKTVLAKVGRWIYEGVVLASEEFEYTNKSGKTARTFQYTLNA